MNNELCDEEQLYHQWVADNLSYMNNNKSCIEVMKKLFLAGFSAGYIYKKKYNAEEQLQK